MSGRMCRGGGQPIHDGEERAFERGKRLYQLDADAKIRYSHDNPDIKRLYEEYFGEPNEHKAHMLLHTDHLEVWNDMEPDIGIIEKNKTFEAAVNL